MQPLISVDELADVIDDVRVCDIRWDLTDPSQGRLTYEAGHIPGAVFVDLDEDLAAAPGLNGRHPLPPIGEFTNLLGSLGITPTTVVVAYDDVGGRIAARLWWMLRSIGHERSRLLDGGYQAWVEAGHDVGVGNEHPEPAEYPEVGGFTGVISYEEVPHRSIIDARDRHRFEGEIEPIDPKPGHIPGALNIPTRSNLGPDGRFLDPETLRDVYGKVAENAAVSCGSGVTACHNALAMVSAGLPMPDVYVGSFSEWSRRDLPVSTGPEA